MSQNDGDDVIPPGSPPYGLAAWLARHPTAMVAAVGSEGQPVPMPEGLPIIDSHQIDGRSFLSLVAPEDVAVVVSTFRGALENGIAVAKLKVVDGTWVQLHYADVREQYGVLLRLVVPIDATEGAASVAPSDLVQTRPRLAVVEKDEIATIRSIDAATTELLGWTEDEMVGHTTLEFIHVEDQPRAIDNWMELVAHGVRHAVRLRYRARDGAWVWLETSNELFAEADGTRRVMCQMIDISEEMAAADALRYSESLLRRMAETVPVGLAELGIDRSVRYMNSTLQALLGKHRAETVADMIENLGSEDRIRFEAVLTTAVEDGLDGDVDILLPGAGAVPDRACRVAIRALTDDTLVLGALLCIMDVTDLKAEAATDPLTGLHNRASIFNVLRVALSDPQPVGLVYMDIDGFKPVNDTYGHAAGDRVLADVAAALRRAVRDGDAVGRLGGDEFVVVCRRAASADAVLDVAHRLQIGVIDVIERSGYSTSAGASVGVAWSEPGHLSAEEIVRRADAAMYAAKRCRAPQPMLWTLSSV